MKTPLCLNIHIYLPTYTFIKVTHRCSKNTSSSNNTQRSSNKSLKRVCCPVITYAEEICTFLSH